MVLCTTIVLFTVVYIVSDAFFLKSYEKFEQQDVEKNVNRVIDALSARINVLDAFCYDWVVWDDTYKFAQDQNRAYIDRNLQDETFISSGLSLFMILNSSGDTVFSKGYDLINSRGIPLPEDIQDIVTAQGLASPASLDNQNSGIMLLSDIPILVVSKPILTSLAEGPSAGVVIIGRFLDPDVITDLSKTTHLAVTMHPTNSSNWGRMDLMDTKVR
jgi:sensor domain CHASE-containing protein